ncbi:hypothetical protein ACVVIH_12960 [Chryseobacterium arthrosphaerae]
MNVDNIIQVIVNNERSAWKGDLSEGTISHRRTFIFHLNKFKSKMSFKEINENLIYMLPAISSRRDSRRE